jgi:hypothetical protein
MRQWIGYVGSSTRGAVPVLYIGPPTRTWKRLLDLEVNDVRERFVPTRVGHTGYPRRMKAFLTVRPHARGPHGLREIPLPRSQPQFSRTRMGATVMNIAFRFIHARGSGLVSIVGSGARAALALSKNRWQFTTASVRRLFALQRVKPRRPPHMRSAGYPSLRCPRLAAGSPSCLVGYRHRGDLRTYLALLGSRIAAARFTFPRTHG